MRIITGLKPTADQLHIGNYFGAILPFFDLIEQHDDAEVFFMLATMHALTTLHDGAVLHSNVLCCAKMYLAMMRNYGFSDDDILIFNQPDSHGHAQLTRVLQCLTHMGFMERMHVYKDAVAKRSTGELMVGTFCYPVLQAVDVLLYDVDYVPVGKDQQQHIEFARDIGQKFNHQFGDVFVLPECLVQASVATVPGTDGRKMSKSYNNFLGLLDDEKTLLKKVKRIPTSHVSVAEPKDPDVCNVYNILKLFLNEAEDGAVRGCYTVGGYSFKEAKDYLYEKLLAFVQPIQARFAEVSDEEIKRLLAVNGEKVNAIAAKKVQEVYKKVGFAL